MYIYLNHNLCLKCLILLENRLYLIIEKCVTPTYNLTILLKDFKIWGNPKAQECNSHICSST